jgi:hypothetical protein
MYSDDIFVVTTKKNAGADMLTTDQVCCNLMGPDSMEQTKAGSGRRLTFIGYDIDLNKRLITISRRNILRALHGFLIVDKDVPMKKMQKLASYGISIRQNMRIHEAVYQCTLRRVQWKE